VSSLGEETQRSEIRRIDLSRSAALCCPEYDPQRRHPKICMMLTGHKTPSIFERYNIIDESDLRAAVEKISEGARREFRDAEDGENGIETPTTKSNLN
jgi:hypothetical protein